MPSLESWIRLVNSWRNAIKVRRRLCYSSGSDHESSDKQMLDDSLEQWVRGDAVDWCLYANESFFFFFSGQDDCCSTALWKINIVFECVFNTLRPSIICGEDCTVCKKTSGIFVLARSSLDLTVTRHGCLLGPLCHGASLADLLWPLGFPNIQVFSKACLLWSIRRGACFQLLERWRSLGSETLMTCPSCPGPFRNMFSLSALRVAVPMNVLSRSVWAAMHSQLYEFSSRNYASSAVLESWVLNGW